MKNEATIRQDLPSPGKKAVLEEVISDLRYRSAVGTKKYGSELKTHNGRDALVDAFQEALDLVMYLKQCLMERDDG